MKTNLLKEAIADAEVIKQLAIDNAKASLNETFDSKIKSMLAAKLQEEAEQDEYDEASQELDEDEEQYEAKELSGEEGEETGEGQDESFDIDAILAEMEEEDKGKDKKQYMSEKKRGGEEEAPEEDPEEDPEEAPEEAPMPKKGKKDMPEKGEGEDNMEEEIDLDALIAEMTKEEESQETDEAYGKEEETDEAYGEEKEKDVLDEEEEKRFYKAFKHAYDKMKPQEPQKPQKESIELQEIKRQAAQLAQKVNETNLINAKLLYLNKVLRNHNLSEQQKLKVVAAFDKAGSVKEAKIVYESINEALNIKVQTTKTALKESLGFASKASGTSTKREIITEADAHVARWQKLAGIRK